MVLISFLISLKEFAFEAETDAGLPAYVSASIFPLLNPLIEELQHLGCAQARLIKASGNVRWGTVIPPIGFGLQHMAFAMALTPVTACPGAFFLWGITAGIIVHKQRRLFPIIEDSYLTGDLASIPLAQKDSI